MTLVRHIALFFLVAMATAANADSVMQDAMQESKAIPLPAVRYIPGEEDAKLALKASYRVYYKGLLAAELRDELWLTMQGGYVLRSMGNTYGLFALAGTVQRVSRGTVDSRYGLLMNQYREKRGRFASWRVAELNDSGSIVFSYGGEQRTEQPGEPVFDFLAAVYVPFMLRQLPSVEDLWVTDGWRLKQYSFIAAGKKKLMDTVYGTIEGWQYRRKGKDHSVWLSPELNFLPVQARGKSLRVELISFEDFL